MEKRKVTISVNGRPYSFYSDDSDEFISALEQGANAVLRRTAEFSGSSPYTQAVLAVLLLTDQLIRTGPKEKETRKRPAKAGKAPDPGKVQISVWDLLGDQNA